MKILTGFLVPDAGTCEVAGRVVEPGDPAGRRAVGRHRAAVLGSERMQLVSDPVITVSHVYE